MTDSNDLTEGLHHVPTPPELMRSWHPDLFSDTEMSRTPIVPRAVLDHHLDTLTNRKQENEFEYFARLLAEKEICPNLRPQTGPHGGGDSKVDTETYPVAQDLASRWYQGEPEAGSERWAFAFSAKKRWRDKVRADVANIISTRRPYKRIYFLTNQYAPDKQRAAEEDSLTALAGVPVTILDRSWILEKVYANDRLRLAIRALNMTDFAEAVTDRPGPRDTARQAELERLDAAVADPDRYGGARYALAEDACESALVARGLERPRSEVEARFQTAARIADDVGDAGQRLRIAYDRAWTAFWWFDDVIQLNEFYDQVAELALVSDDASELERLLNLWQLLGPSVARGRLAPERGQIAKRGSELRAALERVSTNVERPNNAAQARTSLLVMQASQLIQQGQGDGLDSVWNAMREVIGHVDGLGDYPVERTFELITRMGEYVPESDAFDLLYEDLVALLERRRSEAEGGIAYLRRGVQKLEKGFRYDAIRMLGRAETRLIKAEYVDELVETLLAIAQAYRSAGLLWAARSKALVAADRLLSTFRREGRIDPRAALPLKLLIWLELELGRVPQVLCFSELYRMVTNATEQPEPIVQKMPDEQQVRDASLGLLLMRADMNQLRALERAPDMLEQEQFSLARAALLWALSGADAVRRDGFAPEHQSDADIAEFFDLWMHQPVAEQVPLRPILGDGAEVSLRAIVLGVDIVVRVAAQRDSIFLAEAILAALESFLSTSLGANVFPYREQVQFSVRPDSDRNAPPRTHTNELNGAIEVTHGVGSLGGASDYAAFTEWLQDLIIQLSLSMVVIRDPKEWVERVGGDEVGLGRALALSGIGVVMRNIFGDEPRILLCDWIDPAAEQYPLERKTALVDDMHTGSPQQDDNEEPPIVWGQGQPPEELLNLESGGHHQRRIVSAINLPLWDRAQWGATGFAWDGGGPPVLMFGFRDYAAGQAIFSEWRERYGSVDEQDALRIVIVRGIDREKPAAYAVMVSSEITNQNSGTIFITASRINRMYPQDTSNLERFLAAYDEAGTYAIAPLPATVTSGFANLEMRLMISKRRLLVRDAWTIDENEPEMSCIHLDESPVIPEGMTDPPINRTLDRLRQLRRDREQ